MNPPMPCEGGNCQMMPMPEGNLQPQETTPPPPTSFLQKIFGSLVDNTKSLFELFIEIF